MKHLALLLLIYVFATGSASCASATPWEEYVAFPSPENAARVDSISYSEQLAAERSGERITADLNVLAIQVFSGDRGAFRLTLRLLRSAKPGANLEHLSEIAGRYVRQDPKAYLEEVASSGMSARCPGIGYVGLEYVDRNAARGYEINARAKALGTVHDENLVGVREACISQLRK
jgi:hypothetical protein